MVSGFKNNSDFYTLHRRFIKRNLLQNWHMTSSRWWSICVYSSISSKSLNGWQQAWLWKRFWFLTYFLKCQLSKHTDNFYLAFFCSIITPTIWKPEIFFLTFYGVKPFTSVFTISLLKVAIIQLFREKCDFSVYAYKILLFFISTHKKCWLILKFLAKLVHIWK